MQYGGSAPRRPLGCLPAERPAGTKCVGPPRGQTPNCRARPPPPWNARLRHAQEFIRGGTLQLRGERRKIENDWGGTQRAAGGEAGRAAGKGREGKGSRWGEGRSKCAPAVCGRRARGNSSEAGRPCLGRTEQAGRRCRGRARGRCAHELSFSSLARARRSPGGGSRAASASTRRSSFRGPGTRVTRCWVGAGPRGREAPGSMAERTNRWRRQAAAMRLTPVSQLGVAGPGVFEACARTRARAPPIFRQGGAPSGRSQAWRSRRQPQTCPRGQRAAPSRPTRWVLVREGASGGMRVRVTTLGAGRRGALCARGATCP
jgi:hypothetical protein